MNENANFVKYKHAIKLWQWYAINIKTTLLQFSLKGRKYRRLQINYYSLPDCCIILCTMLSKPV